MSTPEDVVRVEALLRGSIDLMRTAGVRVRAEEWVSFDDKGSIMVCCAVGSSFPDERALAILHNREGSDVGLDDRFLALGAEILGIPVGYVRAITRGFDDITPDEEEDDDAFYDLGRRLREDFILSEPLSEDEEEVY